MSLSFVILICVSHYVSPVHVPLKKLAHFEMTLYVSFANFNVIDFSTTCSKHRMELLIMCYKIVHYIPIQRGNKFVITLRKYI